MVLEEKMKRRHLIPFTIGLALLGYSGSFALFNGLKYSSDKLATITIQKGNRLGLLLIGACLFLGALFTLYFISENWACLIGSGNIC